MLSPISSRALVEGMSAAVGLRPNENDVLVATLCKRYGACDALLTDSGTSALILALREILPAGGTVAYPSYGCIDLTTAALGAGMRVRLYDIEPATLSPDLDSVRRVIDRGVDAIVIAHLFGYPADVVGVQAIASERGIPVIEDAAQGAGGSLGTARLGALGDISILSFGRGKGTTAGSGGAVLVRTPPLADWTRQTRKKLRRTSRGGLQVFTLAAQRLLSHPMLYRLPASIPALKLGEMVYRPPHAPRSMTAASAAVLEFTLGLDEREVRGRCARARDLISRMAETPNVLAVHAIAGGESGYLRLGVLDVVGGRSPRPELGALRGYPMTLEQHPQLQPILVAGERAGKGAVFLRDRLFTVPTHSRVDKLDLGRLGEWFGERVATPSAVSRPS